MSHCSNIKPGDIVQITDEEHPWYPALLIVDEVKSWGVQAACLMPQSNGSPSECGQAFNRLRFAEIEIVGAARVCIHTEEAESPDAR